MLKIAVAGVGSLGKHHARILSSTPDAKLEYLVDLNESVSRTAEQYGCGFTDDVSKIIGKVGACVVSLPTPLHYSISKLLLENKIHCLVEKPFTTTVEEAEELIKIARNNNLTLQIGHVERFNPAVVEAQKYISDPIFFEINRLGPFHSRASSCGVVLDLMIHDLDIVLYLARSKVTNVEVIAGSLLTDFEDIAKVRLNFENGAVADLSASRISFKTYRKIRIFQRESYISVDYAKPSLKIYAKKKDRVESLSDIKVLNPRLKKVEPLKMELDHFVACCKTGKSPLVAGEHGRDSLEVAWEILGKMKNPRRKSLHA